MPSLRSLLRQVAVTSLFAIALGQNVQDDWVSPAMPDNSTSVAVGDTFTIKWNMHLHSWFKDHAPGVDPENTDLWVEDFDLHLYHKQIAKSVDVTDKTSISWIVDMDTNALEAASKYTFRFVKAGANPGSWKEQISSPAINIHASTKSSTTTSQSSTSTSATSTATATLLPVTQPAPGMSSGTKIGIVIGASCLALGILVAVWLRERKKNNKMKEMQTRVDATLTHNGASPWNFREPVDHNDSQPLAPPDYFAAARHSAFELKRIDSMQKN